MAKKKETKQTLESRLQSLIASRYMLNEIIEEQELPLESMVDVIDQRLYKALEEKFSKKAPVKKEAAKKELVKKAPAKKTAVKKAAAKKEAPAKKVAAKKEPVKKAPAKKVAAKKK